jgi:hypothetical protein
VRYNNISVSISSSESDSELIAISSAIAHLAMLNPCGPGGEGIVDVVPGGTELELQLRRVVGQAPHTLSNLQVKCTGVYCA